MVQNIKLIDFNDFFNTKISINILDNMHEFGLFKDNQLNLRNKVTKRLILFFVSYHCKNLLAPYQINKPVIVVQPDIISDNSELLSYFNNNKPTKKLILQALKALNKQFPDKVMILRERRDLSNPDTIHFIFNKCNTYKTGSNRLLNNLRDKNGLKL